MTVAGAFGRIWRIVLGFVPGLAVGMVLAAMQRTRLSVEDRTVVAVAALLAAVGELAVLLHVDIRERCQRHGMDRWWAAGLPRSPRGARQHS